MQRDTRRAEGAGAAPEPDHFGQLVEALTRTALELGATRGAAVLRELLSERPLDATTLGPELRGRLEAAGLVASGGPAVRSEQFIRVRDAWAAVLRGQASDLGACGAQTLDVWSSDLLAAVCGPASVGSELRQRLRRRGVAAFGLVRAA